MGAVPCMLYAADGKTKPNVVFFMAEDLSRESFALYNGYAAMTPNLDRLAEHGVVFNNAYSCAPVSSAARSSLITGCYAPSMGLSWHRKMSQVTLPEDLRLFPYYLREAGYYTSNCFKTDYNCRMDKDAWDNVKSEMDGWRERKTADTPFFHCFTTNKCHESSLHFPETDMDTVATIHNPDSVHLYPSHPDTPLFRYTYARHYDAIYGIDAMLGEMVAMLEEDGLLDDTFIFFMGDNGGCLPGTKGYTTEVGLNVPLVIYIPKNFRHLAPYTYGERADGFVSFLDFAPTLLNLAGADIPAHMDGDPILGKDVGKSDVESRDEMYCYGDRYDELYAINRTVRKMDWKYSRNYLPYQPKFMHCGYRYKQAAFRELRDLYHKGALNPVQSAYFEPQGAEELYNLESDPFETHNLAADPEYAGVLARMRGLLRENMLRETDLGVIPEYIWLEHVDDLAAYKLEIKSRMPRYLDVADLQTLKYDDATEELKKALESDDCIERYWALVACCNFGKEAMPLSRLVKGLLNDSCTIVKAKAAIWCAMNLGIGPEKYFREAILGSEGGAATLMVLNDAAFLRENCPQYRIRISKDELRFTPNGAKERVAFISK